MDRSRLFVPGKWAAVEECTAVGFHVDGLPVQWFFKIAEGNGVTLLVARVNHGLCPETGLTKASHFWAKPE